MKKIYIAFSFGLILHSLAAQTGSLSAGSQSFLSNYAINPALGSSDVKFALGLPSLQLDMNNTFKISDLLEKTGSTTFADLNKFAHNLSDKNHFSLAATAQLGHLGIRIKGIYVSVGAELFSNTEASFSNMALKVFLDGNKMYPNVVLNDGNFYHQSFMTTYLGVSRTFLDDKLSIGIRMKQLKGIGHLETEKMNYSVQTDLNSNPAYALQIKTDMVAKAGGIFAPIFNALNNPTQLANLSSNIQSNLMTGTGLGFDLGVSYKINPKINVAASIINIGSLSWKQENGVDIASKGSGTFNWSGYSYKIGADNAPLNTDSLAQSAKDAFIPATTQTAYLSRLPTLFYVGASYQLSEKQQISGVFRSQKVGLFTNTLLGVNYRYQLLKSLQLSGGVSLPSNSNMTVGGGLVWSPGPVQLYLMTDNISNVDNAKRINLQVGLNIVLRTKKEMVQEASKIEPPQKK
ncbi:MAG: hypothetical protein RLZZ628_1102 [Bacteroidota bacterium]